MFVLWILTQNEVYYISRLGISAYYFSHVSSKVRINQALILLEVMIKKGFLGQSLSYKRTWVASNWMTFQLCDSLLTTLHITLRKSVPLFNFPRGHELTHLKSGYCSFSIGGQKQLWKVGWRSGHVHLCLPQSCRMHQWAQQ